MRARDAAWITQYAVDFPIPGGDSARRALEHTIVIRARNLVIAPAFV